MDTQFDCFSTAARRLTRFQRPSFTLWGVAKTYVRRPKRCACLTALSYTHLAWLTLQWNIHKLVNRIVWNFMSPTVTNSPFSGSTHARTCTSYRWTKHTFVR